MIGLVHPVHSWRSGPSRAAESEKAGVVERPEAFDHAGLLIDGPPGPAGLPFIKSSDD